MNRANKISALGIFAVIGTVAVSAFGVDAQQQATPEQQRILRDESVTMGIWNMPFVQLHAGYGMNGWGPAKRIDTTEYCAMRARYLKTLAEIEAKSPSDFRTLLDFGEALMFEEPFAGIKPDYAAAKAKLLKAVAAPNPDAYLLTQAFYRLAECQFALGDREGCRKTLEDFLARKIICRRPKGKRESPDYQRSAAEVLGVMKGEIGSMDLLKLPVFTDTKPYPEPKESKYEEAFTSIAKMKISLVGITKDDARVRLLKTRLARLDVKPGMEGSAFKLAIELTNKAPVAEKEGYSLDIAKDGATIRARDKQGILWGLVSFMQMIDYGAKTVRRGSIRDWPDCANRGFLGDYWPGTAEFAVFQKMNSVNIKHPPTFNHHWTPLNVFLTESLAHQFRDLGLTLYYGTAYYTMYPHLPFAWPESEAFRVSVFKRYAAMGAGVYFPFDDSRFAPDVPGGTKSGLPPPDEEKFGKAKNCDGEYVSRIYRAIKKDYPDFKMIFCPPFYFGPDARSPYPEDREEYLATLAKTLDPAIDVYWTGPRVKGIQKEPYQTEWYTKLVGRKPYIFQNGTGPHNRLGYIVDATDWNGWHYPGFFESEISGFHKNANTPTECCQIATLGDCLWNVKGYDPGRSVKRGVNQLLGEKMYDILAPGLPALAYFDKYKHGKVTAEVQKENADDLAAKVELADDCWRKAVAYNRQVISYGAYGTALGWAKRILEAATKPPDALAKFGKQIAANRALAVKEVGVDVRKGDLFYSPADIAGGEIELEKAGGNDGLDLCPQRFATALRGAATKSNVGVIRYECDPFPPSGDYVLHLCGMDDELPAKNKICIEVNDTKVFEGDPKFENATAYKVSKFTIPFKTMKRYNKVQITNLTRGGKPGAAPCVSICYAVVKKGEN